jgi:hypothetical protein
MMRVTMIFHGVPLRLTPTVSMYKRPATPKIPPSVDIGVTATKVPPSVDAQKFVLSKAAKLLMSTG